MCRRYMEPEHSILLDVFSAMVDFSTSASLQISQELDPDGDRTMLCVTKVYQHKEDGLNRNIDKSMEMMKLDPKHVFAMRNRSQLEKDNKLPLTNACKEGVFEINRLTQGSDNHFGLGVNALSQQLVKIQNEKILQSLPRARKEIWEQISDLKERLYKVGYPVGDASACQAKAVQLIEACTNQFQDEISGRAVYSATEEITTCEGEILELSNVVDDLNMFTGVYNNKVSQKERKSLGGFTFYLQVYRNKDDKNDKSSDIAAYLSVSSASKVYLKSMILYISIVADSEVKCIEQLDITHDFSPKENNSGGDGFYESLLVSEMKGIHGPVTLSETIFVEQLVLESLV